MAANSPRILAVALGAIVVTAVGLLLYLPNRTGKAGAGAPGGGSELGADRSGINGLIDPSDPLLAAGGNLTPGRQLGTARSEVGQEQFRVIGQVISATGIPADERAKVLVYSKAKQVDKQSGWDEALVPPPPETPRSQRDERIKERRKGAESQEQDATDDQLPLAEASIDSAGRFELEIGEQAPELVYLDIQGRYLFLNRRIECDPRDVPVRGIELPAELGMRILGSVSGATGGVQIRLGTDPTAGIETTAMDRFDWERWTEYGPAREFELTGIPSAESIYLIARAQGQAPLVLRLEGLGQGQTRRQDLVFAGGQVQAGRVVDLLGSSIAGAEVYAEVLGGHRGLVGVCSRTRSDADGQFTLSGLPLVSMRLRVNAPGYQNKTQPLPLLKGPRPPVEVVMDPGLQIAGQVLDIDGNPAVGLQVFVDPDLAALTMGSDLSKHLSEKADGKTDELGHFKLWGLSADGRFIVSAEREGPGQELMSARVTGVRPPENELLLRLAPTSRVAGRVVNSAGQAVPKFSVRVELLGSGSLVGLGALRWEQGFESEQGEFRVGGLEPGKWLLSVSAKGYGDCEPIELVLPPPEQLEPLELVLPDSVRIAGRVLSPIGQPIASARVAPELDLFQRMGAANPEKGAAYTDTAGRFELEDLNPGNYELVASKVGFAASEPLSVQLKTGDQLADQLLTLRHGASVTGEVLDDQGRGLSGQTVIFQRVPSISRQVMLETDEEGRFAQDHLEPGSWQVMAMKSILNPDADPETLSQAEVLTSMKLEVLDLVDNDTQHVVLGGVQSESLQLLGRVNHLGKGVPAALVTLIAHGGKGTDGLKIANTDKEGEFEVTLKKSGEYSVTVQMDVAVGLQQSVETKARFVPGESGVANWEFDLPAGAIEGRVLGAEDQPLEGVRVSLKLEGGFSSGSLMGGQYAEAKTGADGSYRFQYLRPGTYQVAAGGVILGGAFGSGNGDNHGRLVASGVEVTEGATRRGVDFQLGIGGELEGLVRDEQGQPVGQATIFVRDEAGFLVEPFSMTVSDGAGRFRMPALAPGKYTVSAQHEGLAGPESDPVLVPADGVGRVEVALVAGTRLSIAVLDDQGASVDARISVVDDFGREYGGRIGMSDLMARLKDGFSAEEQQVGPLPPGNYTITATSADGRSKSKALNLSGQPERRLKLHMR